MGEILKDNYMLDDKSGLVCDSNIKPYVWEVYYNSKLLATFEKCDSMFEYYFKVKKSLSENEKPSLYWCYKEL